MKLRSPQRLAWLTLPFATPALIAFSLALALPNHISAQEDELKDLFGDVEKGKQLFEKEWTIETPTHPNDPDGLGPMFNARSCVACHNQAGTGGAGNNGANVQLLSVLPAKKSGGKFDLSSSSIRDMFNHAEELHPALSDSNAVVWHRFSTNPKYNSWQQSVVEFKRKKKWTDKWYNEEFYKRQKEVLDHVPIVRVDKGSRKERFTVQISHRNTPSLFGTGLIEKIPGDSISNLADKQAKSKSSVRGTVARLPNGTVGRFGWRGQESSLKDFTIQACSVELGLGNSIKEQSVSAIPEEVTEESKRSLARYEARRQRFLEDNPGRKFEPAEPKHDVSKTEIRDMVAYIANLPAPGRKTYVGAEAGHVKTGEALFNSVGCAECHVRTVGQVDGVYSDFLMHDMGEELADVAGVINRRNGTSAIGGYFGPSVPVGPTLTVGQARIWQTPPLWGVSNSAPYMHDGRAKDFHAAIMLHGGESADSRDDYQSLSTTRKRKLLKFLSSLGE